MIKLLVSKIYLYISLLLITILSFSCANNNRKDISILSNDSILNSCKSEYKLARKFQYDNRYDSALVHFKRCISVDSQDSILNDSLQFYVNEAILQLMNTYQSTGDADACVDYLKTLDKSSFLIDNYCKRDLFSIQAYALSRAEDMEGAQKLIEKALSMPMRNSTPERLFRDYAYAAAIFFSDLKRQDDVIDWCNKAIDQGTKCKNNSSVQWVTSMLATIYKRSGKINDAINMYTKAADEAKANGDVLGEANAYNAETELFLYWDMPEFANICVTRSLSHEKRLKKDNPMILGLSYTYKGRAMNSMNKYDSAMIYWGKADKCFSKLPYNSGKIDVDFLQGSYLIDHCNGDSLNNGIEKLLKVEKNAIGSMKPRVSFQLAKGYSKIKNYSECDRMLDSMYTYLHLSETPQFIKGGYNFALKYYISRGDQFKTRMYSEALLQEDSIKGDNEISRKLMKTIVDFRTMDKENRMKMTEIKLDNTILRQRIYISIIIGILILSILVIIYSRKVYKMQHQLMEGRFESLLKDLNTLNDSKVKIENQLSEILTDKESRKKIEVVTPKLFQESGEMKFRERFEQLYPHFIPNLREKITNISRKEELLCMLIVLGQDTFQIEQILCIAHSSVNMARYRLRQKIGLNKDDSLEDTVKSFLE